MPRVHNCLAGCVNDYFVKPLKGGGSSLDKDKDPGRGGIDVENYSPFVSIKLGDNPELITVGNKSYPPFHNAAIRSIDFGFVDTCDGTVEVIDEDGGRFGLLINSLQKCAKRIGSGTELQYKVGWVYGGCEKSQKGKVESVTMSAIINDIEINYGPIFKYRISFSSICPLIYLNKHEKTFGEEEPGKTMHLEDAIVALCDLDPKVNVKFAWYDQSGKLNYGSHDWVNHGKKGPKASWKADKQSKYSIIQRWIKDYRINDGKDGKGALLVHNPKVPDELLVLRNPMEDPEEVVSVGVQHLGTYIVNGGKCSSVLEFSPKFNYINAFSLMSSGGGTGGGVKTSNVKTKDYKTQKAEAVHGDDAGVQQQTTASSEIIFTDGENAPEESVKSQLKNVKANKITGIESSPITADLRIIGDPRKEFFEICLAKQVSIVVINPNNIHGDENNCGDWLKKSDCNTYLSNKIWLVRGINHSVQVGSYVTTIKLELNAPAIDNGDAEKLGANESGKKIESGC